MSIHVIATLVAKPSAGAQVESGLRALASASRREPGNLRYDLFADAGQSCTFHLIEAYRDGAALDAHRQTAHYLAYRASASDWFEQTPVVHVLEALDVINAA